MALIMFGTRWERKDMRRGLAALQRGEVKW